MLSASLDYYIHQNDGEGMHASVGTQWIAIRFAYDPILVAVLKVQFGWEARRWNAQTKKWYVWRDLEARLLTVLKANKYNVEWVRSTRKKPLDTKTSSAKPTTKKPSSTEPKEAKSSWGETPTAKARRAWKAASAPPSTPIFQPSSDHALLEILPTARFEVAKAAYRALCVVYHPDRGGDESKMVALNAAWERLCRKYGRQT
jgi:hypothetical protein